MNNVLLMSISPLLLNKSENKSLFIVLKVYTFHSNETLKTFLTWIVKIAFSEELQCRDCVLKLIREKKMKSLLSYFARKYTLEFWFLDIIATLWSTLMNDGRCKTRKL